MGPLKSFDSSPDHAALLLLGTFHFKETGLNWFRQQQEVGILSDHRQREVEDVIQRLAKFRPTKIAVERRPDRQAELNEEYRRYRDGQFVLPESEVYQLGFRLAARLGHVQLYGIDAWGRYYQPPIDTEPYGIGRTTKEVADYLEKELHFDPWNDLVEYAQQHGQTETMEQWETALRARDADGDQARLQFPLREMLLAGNREEAILSSHAEYLTGQFKIGVGHEYPGVDLITAWYNRNLRIFANLQRITQPGDRILVIYGGGHIPILRHCAQCSPEYELEGVEKYLS